MGLRKKLGVLLSLLGLIFFFSDINSGTGIITGNILGNYFQRAHLLEYLLGIIFLIAGLGLFIERKSLDYLIIPTGDNLDEMKRSKRATEEKANHYIIAGYDKIEGQKIYRELRKKGVKLSEMILEKKSKDTLENVMYSF
jgi:uncharacterized SAM-binding protein YcdF (DUF218 family)